jgi:diphthine-ammonia ligase
MYQTVGQDAIQFIAEALEVPLYRKTIFGEAIAQETEYGSRSSQEDVGVDGDETEDLYALLSTVKVGYSLYQGPRI